MSPGHLLSVYYYMDQSNATFTEQYLFHKVLRVMYSIHYPSFLVDGLENGYKKSTNEKDLIICLTPWVVLQAACVEAHRPQFICQRMRCLVACCGSEVHIELKDVTDFYTEENAKEEEKEENEDPKSDKPTLTETVHVL